MRGCRSGIANYLLIAPAYPADHRHAVVELHHPLDRHQLRPRPADQAAAGVRRRDQPVGGRAAGRRRGTILASAGVAVVLHKTVFGREVTAIGQNRRAARLAGIDVARMRCLTYVLCGAPGRPERRPARRLFPRRLGRPRQRLPPDLDRGRRHRRHLGRRRRGNRRRAVGSRPVSRLPADHAQRLTRRGHAPGRHRPRHRRRHRRRRPRSQEASAEGAA